MGLTDSQSAQKHPLVCVVHCCDDDSHDCNDDIGLSQRNSPKYVRKEVLVGRISARFEPPEISRIWERNTESVREKYISTGR